MGTNTVFPSGRWPKGEPRFVSGSRSSTATLRKQRLMSKLRILIVDDERLVRDAVRHGLAALPQIEIVGECESGLEAIRAIPSQQPDLVLLDVRMQDLTGLDVVRHL